MSYNHLQCSFHGSVLRGTDYCRTIVRMYNRRKVDGLGFIWDECLCMPFAFHWLEAHIQIKALIKYKALEWGAWAQWHTNIFEQNCKLQFTLNLSTIKSPVMKTIENRYWPKLFNMDLALIQGFCKEYFEDWSVVVFLSGQISKKILSAIGKFLIFF